METLKLIPGTRRILTLVVGDGLSLCSGLDSEVVDIDDTRSVLQNHLLASVDPLYGREANILFFRIFF